MLLYEGQEYRASKNWPYAISAGCVVYRKTNDKTEVLILGREPGHSHSLNKNVMNYSLPKGHLNGGDSLEATALRETEEEAGCEVKLTTYLGSTTRTFLHPHHKVKNEKTTHYFAALWQNNSVQMDQEHDSKLWVSPEAAINLLGGPGGLKGEENMISRLKKFLELTND